jgi:hypothetical protein
MNVKELKMSLSKLPPDMNDTEVVIIYSIDNKRQFENLCFTGYIPNDGIECVALGGTTEVERMVKNNEMPEIKKDLE